jgi:hypothetical protein
VTLEDIDRLIMSTLLRRLTRAFRGNILPGVSQEAGVANPSDPATNPRLPLGGGFSAGLDSSGFLGFFRSDGTELGFFTADRFIFVGQGGSKNFEINLNSQTASLIAGDAFMRTDNVGDIVLNASGSLFLNFDIGGLIVLGRNIDFRGTFVRFNNILTSGYGLAPIYGLDNRRGLTAVDASPITLYTTTAAGQLYRLHARIMSTSGTSATYTVKWTEGGTVITKALTITALSTPQDLSILIQPDNGTAITAQLTAISASTVNVAASVEEIA